MKKLLVILAGCGALVSGLRAADLKESKFTQVVNDVQIISSADNSKKAAAVDGVFKIPDVLRTGPASRAELVAGDNTITRVGANTIFSFDQASRSMRLEKGSILFNSPKGKGGGSIHTAAATAAVIGTTVIVSTTPDGGFKVLTLEGRSTVRYQNGNSQRLNAGQMSFVLPGGLPGPVVMFRLDQQVGNSALVKGFGKALPAAAKIEAAVDKQVEEIRSGRAEDTGLLVGDEASATGVKVIKLFDEVSASSTNGTIPGLNDVELPEEKPALPPGFTVPPRLVFSEDLGGFTATNENGLLFVSSPASGTNSATPIEYSAGPADAALDPQTISAPLAANDPRVFRQPVDIFGLDPHDGSEFLLYPSFMGVIGESITISAPTMDLNQFAPMEHFDFLSLSDIHITANLDISASQIPMLLITATGTGRFMIDAGRTVTIDAPDVFIASPGSVSFDGVTLRKLNNVGFLDLSSDAGVTLNNSFVSADETQISSGGALALTGTAHDSGGVTGVSRVHLSSGNGMTVNTDVTADPTLGSVNMVNGSGNVAIGGGAALRGSSINVSSGGGLALNNVSASGNQMSVSGGSFSGADGVTIQNSTLAMNNSLSIQNNRNPLAITSSQLTAGSISANSSQGMELNNNTITASGAVNLSGGNTFTLSDTPVTGNSVRVSTGGSLTASRSTPTTGEIKGDSSVQLNSGAGMALGVNVTAGTTPTSGSITIGNSSGQLTVNPGVRLTAGNITATSADGVLLDNTTVSGNRATFNAGRNFGGGSVTVQNSTVTLTSSLNANSREGLLFNNSAITAGQVGLTGGVSDPEDTEGGPITLSQSSFDLTGGMTIQNDTGILTMNNLARITVAGSVTMDSPNGIVLNSATVVGNQVGLSSGNNDGSGSVSVQNSTVTASSGISVAGNSVGLNNATLTASADLSVQGGSVSLNNTVLDGSTVSVNSDSFITAPNVAPNNGRITGNSSVNLTAQSGGMTLGVNVSANAASGTLNIVNNGGILNASGGKTFQAAFVNVSSPGGLLFDGTTINSGTRVSLTAGNQPGTLAVVQNTAFTGAADVNIAGHTVVLNQVDFSASSLVTLRSFDGTLANNPNTGQQVQGGKVNFIQNVTRGGLPAQDFIGNGITIGRQ